MQTARPGHGPRHQTRLALALALLSIADWGFAAPGGAGAPDRTLVPGRPQSFDVDSRRSATYALTLRTGEYAEIRVEQLSGLAQVEVERPAQAGETRFLDAGKHGIIRISLPADTGGRYAVRIVPYEPDGAAAGRVRASTVRAATRADRERAAAEVLEARAESSRHVGAAASWPQAVRDYESAAAAARRLGDVTLLRDALTGESRLQAYRLGNYRAALALARESVALPDDGDLPGQALAWKNLASAEYFVADYTLNIRAARQALALYRRTGDAYWQGILLGNLAYTYREIGRSALALEAASESLAIARSIHDWFGVDFDLEALAEFHLSRGELDRSFELYQQALESMREHPYPQEQAAVWNGLGELFEVADDPAAAQDAFGKALPLAIGAHDSAGALKVLANLAAVSLQQGEADAAKRYYEQGLERATALALPREQSFLLAGLASALDAAGDAQGAIADYHRAVALATRISEADSEATAWQGLGDAEARSGRTADAAAAYERAYALWSRESSRVRAATALASLARLDLDRGALESARPRIERALALIETSRATLTSRDLRTSYFASQHAYYDLGVSVLMALDRQHPGRGYGIAALHIAERGRARTLLDALNGADRVPSGLVPPDLAEAQRRNREQLDAAYARWRDLLEDPSARADQFAALRRRIDALQRSGDEIEARAVAASVRYAAVSSARPASLARIQHVLLGRDAALLCYWVGESRSYAWLIRRDGVSTMTLPGAAVLARGADELRRAITARLRPLAGEGVVGRVERIRAADRRADELAGELGAELLPGGRSLTSLDTLYVVADGPLFGVPFAALKPQGSADSLVRSMAVLQEPSASVLLALGAGARPHRREAESIAVFADPVYTRDDPRFAPETPSAGRPAAPLSAVARWAPEVSAAALPRLLGSRDEALGIESLRGPAHTVVRMGFDATARSVRATPWTRFDIAHFAVHALVDPEHPQLSGLVLSMFGRAGAPEDGVLRLRDIYALDIPVGLVVLSGCRTLEGSAVPGEGLVGLYRAFLMAGAQAVLGSLWSVEDQATSRFMRALYANLLHRGLSPADALRATQIAFADSRDFAAPYYWAGFSVEGAATGARPR